MMGAATVFPTHLYQQAVRALRSDTGTAWPGGKLPPPSPRRPS